MNKLERGHSFSNLGSKLLLCFCFSLLAVNLYSQDNPAADLGVHKDKPNTAAQSINAKENWSTATKGVSSWQDGMKSFRQGASKELQGNIEEIDAAGDAKAEAKEQTRVQRHLEDQAQMEKNNEEKNVTGKKSTKEKWKSLKAVAKKERARMNKNWAGDSAECKKLKMAMSQPSEKLESPFKSEASGKPANKRIGHPYTPKFQGTMLFQQCQGFVPQDWDMVVGSKASGPENFVGSWDNLANTLIKKLEPFALTPRQWSLAIEQLSESKTYADQIAEIDEKIEALGSSGMDDSPELPRLEALKKNLEKKKDEWEGTNDTTGLEESGGKVSEKLKEIKTRLSKVFSDVVPHFAMVRKCAALVHLTSKMDYNNPEYTSPGASGGEDDSFNKITMQMQMAQQMQNGEAQSEQMELSMTCASSGAETQDFPACRKSISQMNMFRIATQGFNVAMKLKMDSDSKKRLQKVKCQADYIANPDMEITVSTDPESPGCAEYITRTGKTNVDLIEQSMREKKLVLEQRTKELDQQLEKEGLAPADKIAIENEKKSIDQEINVLMKSQTERLADQKKRSKGLSVQQLALEAQKEGIEAQKNFQFAKMGFQASKLAVLASSFKSFPDKARLHAMCKQGLGNLDSVGREHRGTYEEWLEKIVKPYEIFKCAPFNYNVTEFVRGNIHGGEMTDAPAEEAEEQGGDGDPPQEIMAKDKTTSKDPCQDVIGGSTVALLRNQSAREQLKVYLMGVGKDALVSFMQGMIYNNQANVVQAAINGTKALEQPFTMTPILTENYNKLCANNVPFRPGKICDSINGINKKGKIMASDALKISFQGGAATKIAPRKRLKLGVNRKAGNIKASSGGGGVDSLGSGGDDMGGGGEEEGAGEPQNMGGLGEVASSEGGGGGDAGGPGLSEGGGDEGGRGDAGQAAIGDEGGSDLQGGELQVAQFQGGGKMAGGGVGSDMGGMVSGGDGGQMNFRGPAGDGGLAGRAKGIFKIISKRYKSINGRNKLLKYEKK